MSGGPAEDYGYLPNELAAIARAAGLAAALKLAQEVGGQTVYIPARPSEGHWLAQLVGLEAARKICKHYVVRNSGADVLIPMAHRATATEVLKQALRDGVSARVAASTAGVHERTVFRWRARMKLEDDERQGRLF